MSDLIQTAVLNWLKATADDAMGMEFGDRHMANEAKKHIEFQAKRIAELEGEIRGAWHDHGVMADGFKYWASEAKRLEKDNERLRTDLEHHQHDSVLQQQCIALQKQYLDNKDSVIKGLMELTKNDEREIGSYTEGTGLRGENQALAKRIEELEDALG